MTDSQHPEHSPIVRDHWWWRPGWHQGRRAYTFHVIFNDGTVDRVDGLYRLVRGYQAGLKDLEGLNLIPLEWLHLTVQGVGFVDEVSQDDVQAIVAAVGKRCAALAPFDLAFGPAVVTDEGIMLPGSPEGPVQALRWALRAGIADVWGVATVPEGEAFTPHVSVAYSNADGSGERFVQAVQAWVPEAATVRVRAASLIVLDRDARMYRWTRHASVMLGTN